MSRKKTSAGAAIKVPEPAMLSLADVNEATYNPRVMTPEMLGALKKSLRKHGFVLNLVVQRRGMVLVGGHQRLRALRELAEESGQEPPEQLPAIVLDLTDAEAKELNVALNKIDGEFDPYKLGALFASIRDELTLDDIEATGFTVDEVDQSILLIRPVEEQITSLEEDVGDGVGAFAKSITLSVEFDTVEERDQAKVQLKELAAKQGKGVGKVVLAALRSHALSAKPKASTSQPPAKKKRKAA